MIRVNEAIDQKFKEAILDAVGEGITIIDEDLKIVWVNFTLEVENG